MLAQLNAASRQGSTIHGKYRLERVLGEGGMGVVYAARHVKLDRPVAIKVMHPQFAVSDAAVGRFFDEARAAGSLRHPNVIDVVDVDTDESHAPFMVMEMLEGESLAAFLARRGPVPADELVALLEPVLDGLAAAHARGIVHRDLKPDNVFLARVGTTITPKVLDFGIAKLRDPQTPGTATGAIVGTPMYMSPEQAAGSKDIGPWVDVWAMGALYFEAISGRSHLELPPDAGLMAILSALATQTPARIATIAPATPPTIAAAIDAALMSDPARRLRSIEAFRAMLRGESAPVAAAPPSSASTPSATFVSARTVPSTRLSDARTGSGTSRAVVLVAIAIVAISSIGLLAWMVLAPGRGAGETPAEPITATDPGSDETLGELEPADEPGETAIEETAQGEQGAPGADDEDALQEGSSVAPSLDEVDLAEEPIRSGTTTMSRPGPRAPTEPPSRTSTRTGAWNPDDL